MSDKDIAIGICGAILVGSTYLLIRSSYELKKLWNRFYNPSSQEYQQYHNKRGELENKIDPLYSENSNQE
ncbi:MAG: hypothetical protein ABIH65_01195 [Nanoarchaeota archaeon]